ncbi:MAG: hypothetical protein AB1483_06535 [Candidatus Zixiibacteriota bacterium]
MLKKFWLISTATMLASAILAVAQVGAASEVVFDNHDIKLVLDVPTHSATIEDSGRMNVSAGGNMFMIAGGAKIENFTVDGQPVEYVSVKLADTATLTDNYRGSLPEIEAAGQPLLVFFDWGQQANVEFTIKFSAEFFEDVENIRFSNEKVGTEVTGTILDKGAYLSSDAYFYPQGSEDLVAFKLTADVPEKWEAVSDGNKLSSETAGGRKVQTWGNPYKCDGATFFASHFEVGTLGIEDGVSVTCYFFPEDVALMNNYLSASANYIRMYNDLIGPYPFKNFSVVENFFPTGYGMPGWTLLGQQVLRLPFIIRTSLGHEVLHNWWGNSVYVDYDRGNWCEGATVYGADYRYKLSEAPDEALDYRKDILKQYISYVNAENDFPLRAFKSRTSPDTRTIGYNKAMMVYHMIEEQIGSDAFFAAWKLIYNRNLGKKVSWEDWIAAFEETSGQKIYYIIPQWIDRAGAPKLDVAVIESKHKPEKKTYEVKLQLGQMPGDKYLLQVPIRFSGTDYVFDTTVTLRDDKTTFKFKVPDVATSVEVDPDYHLFRRLYPEEVEPVVSAILGNPNKQFVTYKADDSVRALFRVFGTNLTEDSVSVASAEILATMGGDEYAVLLNPSEVPEYLKNSVIVKGDSVKVDGVSYSRLGHTVVAAGQDLGQVKKYLVIITHAYPDLPRLGQLLMHYGRYSYLVFNGTRNVAKGQWKPETSPLKIQLTQTN